MTKFVGVNSIKFNRHNRRNAMNSLFDILIHRMVDNDPKRLKSCDLNAYTYKFIHTPKHGSWLNMAEMEIIIMDRQCTGGKIASKEVLESEVMSWSNDRNEKQRCIEWKFTRQ